VVAVLAAVADPVSAPVPERLPVGGAPARSGRSDLSVSCGAETAVTMCPHCRGTRLRKHGRFVRKDGGPQQRYRCLTCGRTFNPDTKTPAAFLKKRTRWQQMIARMNQSCTLRAMAAELGVHLSTAFRWRHRWLADRCRQPQPALEGQVSVAMVAVPYSEKGSRVCRGPGSWGYWNWLRRGPKPGGEPWPDRNPTRFRPLIDGRPHWVLLGRSDALHRSLVVGPKPGVETLGEGLEELVDRDAEVYGFEWVVEGAPSRLAEACRRVGLSYRDGREVSRNYRDGVSRRSARGQVGVAHPESPIGWLMQFRGVATKYLHHYMAWFSYQVTGMLCKEATFAFSPRTAPEA